MDKATIETSRLYARIAGFSYIITMALGIFSVNFVEASLIIPGDNAATLNNIAANEFIFRVGVAGEILMYVLVILLAFSLFVVLKTINQNLAFIALLWRIGEAIIGSTSIVLSGLIPILLIKNGSAFEPEKLQTLLKLFLNLRSAGLDIVLIFIGMGGTIFCYLFYKSGYIPKILAGWGILTYLVMLLLSFAAILTPIADSTKIIFYAPGGLFELLLGLWLSIKSINTGKLERA